LDDVAAQSAGLHSNVLALLAALVRRPIRALEGVGRPASCPAAQASRPNHWVARRAIDLDWVVGSSPLRAAGSKRSLRCHRARALRRAVSTSSRLRA